MSIEGKVEEIEFDCVLGFGPTIWRPEKTSQKKIYIKKQFNIYFIKIDSVINIERFFQT